jgi:hypothetical protein
MFLFCVSLPGHFGTWCDAVIGRLAQATLGSVYSTGANSAEELAVELIKSDSDHVYVGARHPGRWLRDMLADGSRKFVVALEDPRRVASELICAHQMPLAEACRLAASSCASMTRFAALPTALVVACETAAADPEAAAAAMAGHLDLRLDRPSIARLVADLAAAGVTPGEGPATAAASGLPEQSAAAIEGALAPYAEWFRGGGLTPITWTRHLFLDDGHRPASHPIDLAGGIRYLIYGPYISLPAGSWLAELVLGFSEDAVDMSYRIEVWAGSGSQLAMLQIQPTAAGLQRINVNFGLDEGNDNPVEIRVVNERPAQTGRLVLGQATLSQVRDISPEVVDTLTAELGLLPDSELMQTGRLSF